MSETAILGGAGTDSGRGKRRLDQRRLDKEQEKRVEIKVSSKGQIVIPSSIRRRLGIKEGTRIKIEFKEDDKEIILKPRSVELH